MGQISLGFLLFNLDVSLRPVLPIGLSFVYTGCVPASSSYVGHDINFYTKSQAENRIMLTGKVRILVGLD